MITRSVTLRCDPARAFSLFTENAGKWWPADRRHTDDESSTIRIEPTGRFFERANDGTEVELGIVLVFEPNRRLVIDWYPGTGPERATRVDVHFEAVDRGTRVTVSHHAGGATAETFSRNAPIYERSWDAVLAAVAEYA